MDSTRMQYIVQYKTFISNLPGGVFLVGFWILVISTSQEQDLFALALYTDIIYYVYRETEREKRKTLPWLTCTHTKNMPTVRLKRHIQKFDVLKIAMQTESKKDKQNKTNLQN